MGAKRAIHRLIVNREVSKEVSVKYIKARTALNKILPIRVKDEKEFHVVIIRIVQFLESKTGITISNGVAVSNDELALQKAEMILSRFGNAGLPSAKDAAMTGIDGGVMAVADAIYSVMKEQGEDNYIEAVLREEVDPFDEFDKIKFVEEYVQLKGLSLPESARKTRPEELISRYKELIRRDLKIAEALTKTLGL